MSTLRQSNQSLYRMTIQTQHLAAAHQNHTSLAQRSILRYRAIKIQAASFYSALSNGWKCSCIADHSVSLRLEARTSDGENHDEDEGEESMQRPFHVLFRYDSRHSSIVSRTKPWTWDEADVRLQYDSQTTPISSSGDLQCQKGVRFAKVVPRAVQTALEPLPDLQPIQDLCSTISDLQKPQRNVCLSLLANEIAKQKYGVLLITPAKQLPSGSDVWSITSLGAVLDDSKFAQQDRLKLAITLASSVLQLHETPWLEEQWGRETIFFVNRTGKPQYDQPFVSQRFRGAVQPAASVVPHRMGRIIRNQTLYALGVALIELYYRKPIAELRQDVDGPQKTGNASEDLLTEFNTADRLAEDLLSEAGLRYSDAVRRCIHCDFDQRSRSLEDTKFQTAVYQGVVSQLQKDYQSLFDQAN